MGVGLNPPPPTHTHTHTNLSALEALVVYPQVNIKVGITLNQIIQTVSAHCVCKSLQEKNIFFFT